MGHSNRFGSCAQHTDKALTDISNLIKRILGILCSLVSGFQLTRIYLIKIR